MTADVLDLLATRLYDDREADVEYRPADADEWFAATVRYVGPHLDDLAEIDRAPIARVRYERPDSCPVVVTLAVVAGQLVSLRKRDGELLEDSVSLRLDTDTRRYPCAACGARYAGADAAAGCCGRAIFE